MQLAHKRDAVPVDRERIFALDDVQLTADGSVAIDLSEEDAMLGRRGADITVNGRAIRAGTFEVVRS